MSELKAVLEMTTTPFTQAENVDTTDAQLKQ